jgi:2-oxoglutarate dehydrogenase E2 component (dihydrolipoamide succinyltransferase)
MTDVLMPQLGESVVEGTISRWLKRVGDPVRAFEPLLEVSTDKVDTEIPAPADGVLLEILVEAGATVAKGTRLAVIGAAGSAPAPEREPAAAFSGAAPHITPVVARMAAEYQIDLAQIAGTGRGGRVTKKDVEAFLAQRRSQPVDAPPKPWDVPGGGDLFSAKERPAREEPPPAPAAELIPHSPMRRQIADHMVMSARTSPHVTTVFEVDMSAVVAHREAHKAEFAAQGVNLTLTAYFVLAAVAGLRAAPILNARWTDEGVLVQRVFHIGIAVAIPDGLIVPVIKNAGDLSLLGAARAVSDLAARARAKQLKPDEVQGGTFTITNHGVAGSLFATPIIHQPQMGILGIGAVEKRVKVVTDAFGSDALAIRPCCYLSLSFDHRAADGAAGDGFLLAVKRTLESWT